MFKCDKKSWIARLYSTQLCSDQLVVVFVSFQGHVLLAEKLLATLIQWLKVVSPIFAFLCIYRQLEMQIPQI